MKKVVLRFLTIVIICVTLSCTLPAFAVEDTAVAAENKKDSTAISYDGKVIKISSERYFSGIYIEWSALPGNWSLFDGEK